MNITTKIEELAAINAQRNILEREIDDYCKNACRGKSYYDSIKILVNMPDTIYRHDHLYFLRQIHLDSENNEITDPQKIKEHFKQLCEDDDLESSIALLSEMRSDIDKSELIEYFKKTKK